MLQNLELNDKPASHSEQMWAIIKSKPEKGLWMGSLNIPQPGPDVVLIKVTKVSICGTDKHIYDWDNWASSNIALPLILGHEFVGTVLKVGSAVTGLTLGDRVSAKGHVVCNACSNCRSVNYHLYSHTKGFGVNIPVAFSQFLCVPRSNIVSISDEMASLLDPLGNAVHTALSVDVSGQDVVVTGAGPIGIMAALVCQHVGAICVVLTEVNPYRIDLARKAEVRQVADVRRSDPQTVMRDLSITEGFGVGLEMSGTQDAINTIFNTNMNGCCLAILGISNDKLILPWNDIVFKIIHLKGIYGREIFETWKVSLDLLQNGLNIEGVIAHCLPFEDLECGFSFISSSPERPIRSF